VKERIANIEGKTHYASQLCKKSILLPRSCYFLAFDAEQLAGARHSAFGLQATWQRFICLKKQGQAGPNGTDAERAVVWSLRDQTRTNYDTFYYWPRALSLNEPQEQLAPAGPTP